MVSTLAISRLMLSTLIFVEFANLVPSILISVAPSALTFNCWLRSKDFVPSV